MELYVALYVELYVAPDVALDETLDVAPTNVLFHQANLERR